MTGRGHNGGPPLGPGSSWARHCWSEARRALLPTLPIEVVRLRVARAREIGLEYRTYATIRATTGRDVIALLFSTEALRLRPRTLDLPEDRRGALAGTAADRLILTAADLQPAEALMRLDEQGVPFKGASPAPAALAPWSEARALLRAALDPHRLPSDAVVLVGEGRLQHDWAEAARLAAFLPQDRFFGCKSNAPL